MMFFVKCSIKKCRLAAVSSTFILLLKKPKSLGTTVYITKIQSLFGLSKPLIQVVQWDLRSQDHPEILKIIFSSNLQ